MDSFHLLSKGTDETSRCAATTASFLQLGDLVILTGDLATGKTHFVKALAHSLGCTTQVTSPTYTIAHFYNTASGNMLHLDLYRLSGQREFRDLGLDEYFPESMTVIEWGDKIASDFTEYLAIAFDFTKGSEQHRTLTFTAYGDRWLRDMPGLYAKLSDCAV